MPGGFAAGLSGLAGVPGGYTQGGQQWLALQQAQTEQAAQQALGRALMGISNPAAMSAPQGATPGALPGPSGMNGPGGLPPPPTMGGIPGPPGPAAHGGMPGYQPPPGFVNPTRIAGQPQNLTGPPIPPGGMAARGPMPGAGGGAAPPMAPPGPPPQPPSGGPGGPPTGIPPMQSMDWRQVAQMVAQANPGAPPEVIAAAVTKAIPLMNSDSQQQWRMVQAQLAEQRISQGYDRLDETRRAHEATEAGRTAGREERQREFDNREQRLNKALDFRMDTKATELQQRADAARQRATGLQASQDLKTRQQAVKEARDRYNDFDKHMRTKIQADSTLSGQEKKDAIKELDSAWAQHERDLTTATEQNPMPGSSTPGSDRGLPQRPLTEQDLLNKGRQMAPSGQAPGKYTNPQTGQTGTWDGKTWTPD
jgi:hypothetical protein